MSAPGGAPSPVPRSGSIGPGANGGGMSMNSQQPMSGTPMHPSTPGPPPPQSGAMSQQNLNQIVLDLDGFVHVMDCLVFLSGTWLW
ncbi:hypothetical protein N7468_000827 [Penicillium chermesinum]|uniref:Uncharacterized protein n=1 Tax=Penicillium chermesinum TaxID=63820 RepID=A0A9W9TY27_9EURO|nr:uncharacterized protein N7468_000827 [Penicillium chermesinum]KAJ5245844.1 hypothetical protein N7468_000827 [Penicillium chermesinum]KAJ6144142.1 hypothetical protein N7470_008037 [Penicillium chermesinum]